jgi:FkbM family methyltransferase
MQMNLQQQGYLRFPALAWPKDAGSVRAASSRRLGLMILVLGVGVLINASTFTWFSYHDSRSGEGGQTPTTTKSLADDCYHVFLDVGANIGVHSRFLFEPHLYPDATTAHMFFNQQFGPPSMRDNRDICTFAFEPNPNHAATLQRTSEAYLAQGWRYYPNHVGVSDQDGSMSFHRNDATNAQSEWGFSVQLHVDHTVETVAIPVIRFADWLKTHIESRRIPDAVYGNYSSGPQVLMKMDIEGMEFLVLPDLMLSGVLCTIDLIFGEFHPHFAPYSFPGHRAKLDTTEAAWDMMLATIKVMHASRNCNTTFVDGDDEHYLLDGMPLPGPNPIGSPAA